MAGAERSDAPESRPQYRGIAPLCPSHPGPDPLPTRIRDHTRRGPGRTPARVQVTRQARSMSASASRPRRTVQADGRLDQAGEQPDLRPEPSRRQQGRPDRQQPRGDGRRRALATDSSTQPADGPISATSQIARGGFSSQGRPPIVGTRTSPLAIISAPPGPRTPRDTSVAPRGPAPPPASTPPTPRPRQPRQSQAGLGHASGPP